MLSKFLKSGNKKGESLVEVIVAIFVISMGSAVATSLVVSALQSNQFSRDNLIGLNLAVEGMEAMRGIRDSNWLKYSFDKNGCWNMRPDVPECTDVGKIIAGRYTVDINLLPNKYSWDIKKIDGPVLDLSKDGPGNVFYQLSYYDINNQDDSDNHGTAADDRDVIATNGVVVPPEGAFAGVSPFYRMLNIFYPANTDSEMDVTSTVQWLSQGVKHEVALTGKLTNYQKVKTE